MRRYRPAVVMMVSLAAACGGAPVVEEAASPVAAPAAVAPSAGAAVADPVAAAVGAPVVDDTAALAALERGNSQLVSGDLAGARSTLEALRSHARLGARAEYGLGVIAYAEQQEAQAVEHFEAALRADPAFAPALVGIVRNAVRQGDLVGARRAIEAQVRASDSAPGIRAVALYVTLAEGRHEQVIRDGRALLLEDDANLDVFYCMGSANLALGRVELARYIFQQGIERDPNRAEFYFGLATIEMEADNNPGARSWLRRALDVQVTQAETWNNLGVLYLETRAFDEAVDAFRNAVQYAPDYREAWLNLGSAYKGAQEYGEAVAAYNRAIDLDPSYADPYFNLGVMYLDTEIAGIERMERYEQAIAYFEQYRDRAGTIPGDHTYHTYLSEAQRLYQTQVELETAPPPAEPSGDTSSETGGDGEDDWGDDWGAEPAEGGEGTDAGEGSGSDDDWDEWEDW